MKRPILLTGLLMTITLVFSACGKNETHERQNESVELFLLSSYKTIGSTNQINDNSIVTNPTPLVSFAEFKSYDPASYTFKISDSAKAAILGLKHSVFGIAFAIKANNELIYSGYFWPSYSSASCSWVVIDPLRLSIGNDLQVFLGYPGLINGQVIPDKRNDQRILDIFSRSNKLLP